MKRSGTGPRSAHCPLGATSLKHKAFQTDVPQTNSASTSSPPAPEGFGAVELGEARELIRRAVQEDVPQGDVTTEALFSRSLATGHGGLPRPAVLTAAYVPRQSGVLCGVPVVQIPCKNVAEHLRTTVPEMAAYVKGRGAIGDYLYRIFCDYHEDHFAWSKVIWDISAVAYLNDPDWVPTEVCPSPVLCDDITWGAVDETRHPCRIATDVRRDQIFGDLFRKLAARGS